MSDPDVIKTVEAANPDWKQSRAPTEYRAPVGDPAIEVSAGRERANALAGLASEAGELAQQTKGNRNDELNRRTWKMYQKYGAHGHLSVREIYDALMHASRLNGHVQDDGQMAHNTCAKALDAAAQQAGYAPTIDWHAPPAPKVEEVSSINGQTPNFSPPAPNNGHANGTGETGREIRWATAIEVRDQVPRWGWHYDGKGRIQNGTLAIFTGRPGAGKSTAARWLISEATNGKLGGCWHGDPVNVAYIATEEPEKFTVVPSLRAAGADLSRVFLPRAFQDGQHTLILSTLDEQKIGQFVIDNEIRIVVVDALVTTIGGAVDINKNNEVRTMLMPWARIAEATNGIVIGVTHLRKGNNGDVVAAINGSSAFGEIARSIFAFAKRQDNDERVFSQHKNSTGFEDLSLTYELRTQSVTVSTGEITEVAKFVITGNSDVTVEDVLSDRIQAEGSTAETMLWLRDYLSINGPDVPRKDVIKDGDKAGYKQHTLKRAAKKLKVVSKLKGFPCEAFWSASEAAQTRAFSEPETDDEM